MGQRPRLLGRSSKSRGHIVRGHAPVGSDARQIEDDGPRAGGKRLAPIVQRCAKSPPANSASRQPTAHVSSSSSATATPSIRNWPTQSPSSRGSMNWGTVCEGMSVLDLSVISRPPDGSKKPSLLVDSTIGSIRVSSTKTCASASCVTDCPCSASRASRRAFAFATRQPSFTSGRQLRFFGYHPFAHDLADLVGTWASMSD
jgi:hypothetical protein